MWITKCMYIQGENLCELQNDEIITNKKNMRSAIWGVNWHTFSVC
jgi:hypothetical protein